MRKYLEANIEHNIKYAKGNLVKTKKKGIGGRCKQYIKFKSI